MKRTCKQCGKEFELTESEISFYKSKGLELPKRCQTCRNQNKGVVRRTQGTDKGQNSARPNISSGNTSRNNRNNNRNNDNGRNDKSYIVVAIAVVVMVLAAFLVKNNFSADSERLLVSDDAAILGVQSEQEGIGKSPGTVGNDTSDEEQQPAPSVNEDKDQGAEKESQLPESTDEESAAQVQDTLSQDEQSQIPQATRTEITSQTAPETSGKLYKFRKAQYLTEHFQKHGEEFPYSNEEEYLQGANNVINSPDALHKLEAEDGDDVYFIETTNEFVVVSTDGFIRTYFIADIDYYNRQ